MKIIIVSGFLGSGKTTFIENFSKKLDRPVILENDYSKVNIDTSILENKNMKVLSLEDGCICCSKKTDFATSVLTISNTLNPEYLIIEPTGLGYLSNVINNIKKVEYDKIELLSPICIVDYNNIDNNLKEYRDIFLDQIKHSNIILLSKTENIDRQKIENSVRNLKNYTDASIYLDHYSEFDSLKWNSLIKSYDDMKLELSEKMKTDFDTFTYSNVCFKNFNELGTTLNAVSANRFGNLLRAKGFVNVGDKKVKIDIVQGKFNIQKCEDNSYTNKVVFIGEKLEKEAFDILFRKKKQNIKAKIARF